jgi:hypothetical protein
MSDVDYGLTYYKFEEYEDLIPALVIGDGNLLMQVVEGKNGEYGLSFNDNKQELLYVTSTSVKSLDNMINMFRHSRTKLAETLKVDATHNGINGEVRGISRIVSAANRLECGLIFTGARHCDELMRAQAKAANKKLTRSEQGFVDQKGNFYSREDAWKIAIRNNQIIYRVGGDTANGGTLYSENLY